MSLSRRDIIKLGMFGGGVALIPSHHLFASIPSSFWDDPKSPATTPFIQPLPAPPPVQTVKDFELDPRCQSELEMLPARMQRKVRMHKLVAEEVHLAFHPELPTSRVWRYRDVNTRRESLSAYGPTFNVRMGTPQILRFMNRLPLDHTGFGVTELTTHLHGGHVPAFSDGFPGPIQDPDFQPLFGPPGDPHLPDHYDYCYPMGDPGFLNGEPDPGERPALLWYHDHLLDFTGPNVMRGLAGLYRVFDEIDSGDETDTTPGSLRLPSGAFDVPLVLADRLIAPDGSLLYLPGDFDGFLGDKYLVNGVVQPFFRVKGRKYRLRLLNGSNARMYNVSIRTESGEPVPFDLISTTCLLSRPLRDKTEIFLTNAHRREIVVDFSRFPEGTVLYLEDDIVQDDGRGPDGKFDDLKKADKPTRLMKFIVEEKVDDPSQVPDELRPFERISNGKIAAAKRREFRFERRHGSWVINGEQVDLDRVVAQPKLNEPEVWRIFNNSGGWWHPIHVHSEFGRIIKRHDEQLQDYEEDGVGKADTVTLGGGSDVEVYFDFRDFDGPWVFHCHNIEHEDHFMMARFTIRS